MNGPEKPTSDLDHPLPETPGSRGRVGFRRACRAGVALGVMAYLASGIFAVRPNEVGIVRRFGKVVVATAGGRSASLLYPPGLHYRLPYPITRLNKVRPAETRTVAIGFDPMDGLVGMAADPRAAEFLTGDQNIMRLRMTVQYTIGDPILFLFGAGDPEALLRREAEACLARAVAAVGVDHLIGAERVKISDETRQDLEREMERHHPGVKVTAVSLQAPSPPQEVADAFNDVQSAKAEKDQMTLEAEGYRNKRVTEADGEADKLKREAEAYRQRRVAEAQGEAKRFEDRYEEYRQARRVTALRLYLDTMEEVLPRMKKVLVDSDEHGGPVDLGIIDAKR